MARIWKSVSSPYPDFHIGSNSPVASQHLREIIRQFPTIVHAAIDACTVVGNCLMISRRCWDATGEFDPMWKSGYGEETDFQMRAMQRGFRGVALIDTYVYHFGSATFRYDPALAQIQKNALATFLSTWGDRYREYAARCASHDPVDAAAQALDGK